MNEARQAIYSSFANPDPASVGVYNMISEVYPAFAKKLFHNNKFMEKLVMTGLNPMHILDYPICGRCETLAVPDKPILKDGKWHKRCGCFADGCGAKTIDPITLKDWLRDELKKKAPKSYVDKIDYVLDKIALAMLVRFERSTRAVKEKSRFENQRKMGLLDSYGNPIIPTTEYETPKRHKVTLTESSKPVDLGEEAKRIGKEENADVRQIE